ncbi:hypothetical protein COV16_02490 [Candidatus Woesearchaeota archaeon CG10_big_fil_rev_8_21_14_0_10_34_8]|nr:MAG: hypothetical protein COV16_02490 [Candidatus Woesearchaeota archaeon CG10_big_fil_rev_8_21_14_0_10_34_8]
MGISGKRGFMFTLVAIFLIAIFVFVLYASTSRVFVEKQALDAERTEAIVVNMFTKHLTDSYIDTFLKVASTNALRAMVAYVETGTVDDDGGIEDPEAFYREIIMNGSIESTYDASLFSRDFAMTLTALNNSEAVTITSVESSGTAWFGNTTTLVQRVSSYDEAYEHLSSITLTITDNSATSSDIYIVVYNSTGQIAALVHQNFNSDGDYTFNFGGTLPFTTEDYYDIMLAAPFTDTTSDYDVDISSSSSAFDCSGFTCNMAAWDLSGTGTDIILPIDFVLDEAIVGEGFLRNLAGELVSFGRQEMNINTSVEINDIIIDEKDAWTIGVMANFTVSTSRTTVSFSGVEADGEAEVSIIGLNDPYNTLMDWDVKIPVAAQNVSDDFDVDDLYRHLSEQTFVFNENAPSFLQRFAGEDAADSNCCGIQTVLSTSDLSAYSGEELAYSFVDHEFMTSSGCDKGGSDPTYAYYISNAPTDWGSAYYGGSGPYFDYEDIEFYHMDEIESDGDITIGKDCPKDSGSSS